LPHGGTAGGDTAQVVAHVKHKLCGLAILGFGGLVAVGVITKGGIILGIYAVADLGQLVTVVVVERLVTDQLLAGVPVLA